jgi:hypothetical protein
MSDWQSAWLPSGSLVGFPYQSSYRDWNNQAHRFTMVGNDDLTWRNADYTWWEALKFDHVVRGRSSTQFIWRGVDRNMLSERYYPMFPVDLSDLIDRSNIINGYVRHEWKVVKRGANYGIARADS